MCDRTLAPTGDEPIDRSAVSTIVNDAVDALWPLFGGNHQLAEFWTALADLMQRVVNADDPVSVLATPPDAEAEVERLRDILRTIVSRAEDAKRMCADGHPVSAYNLASGILGQIGSDVATLRSPEVER